MKMKRETSIMEITPEIGAFCSEGFLPEKPVEAASNYLLTESMDYCMQTKPEKAIMTKWKEFDQIESNCTVAMQGFGIHAQYIFFNNLIFDWRFG